MKANVYVVKQEGGWSAWMTVSPEVDYAYWFGRGRAWEEAEMAWFWQEELPLGQAAEAVQRWKERSTRTGGIVFARMGLSALWDRSGYGGEGGGDVGNAGKGDDRYNSKDRVKGQRNGSGHGRSALSEAEAVGVMSRIIDEIRAADNPKKQRRMFEWASSALAERRGSYGSVEVRGEGALARQAGAGASGEAGASRGAGASGEAGAPAP